MASMICARIRPFPNRVEKFLASQARFSPPRHQGTKNPDDKPIFTCRSKDAKKTEAHPRTALTLHPRLSKRFVGRLKKSVRGRVMEKGRSIRIPSGNTGHPLPGTILKQQAPE
jgi:hypothetical protein